MGDIKRKKGKIKKPKKSFDKKRIEEEAVILRKYGLKNKKEIWKAEAEISKLRSTAKNLIRESEERKKEFFEKLNKIGFNVKNIPDILGLTKEDQLERRLQTFVFKKGFAKTAKQARQLITHKNILINKKVVNIPSFIITKELENKISLKERKHKTGEKKEEKPTEESKEERKEKPEELKKTNEKND